MTVATEEEDNPGGMVSPALEERKAGPGVVPAPAGHEQEYPNMNGVNTTTNGTTAEALERAWRALGFTEGAPKHIRPDVVGADLRIYRAMRCGACHHRGHAVKAMHRGHQYRLLCSCKKCGAGMEG